MAQKEWTETLREKIHREVVGVDGKSMRASRDVPENKKAVHIVSAWATKNRLILWEVATNEKSNEITAIPQLLDMLELTGCIATIDAMGTQTKAVEKIIGKGTDYLLPVKENHPQLLQDIRLYFDEHDNLSETAQTLDTDQTLEKAHGRIEKREWIVSKDIDIIRHFVLNLLSRDSSSKGGISSNRKRCALSSSS